MGCINLVRCVLVLRCGLAVVVWYPLVLLLLYSVLNMFRMLIHPSSGACDLFVELFHGLYLVRCVLVLRCGFVVVVWYPYAG